MVFLGDAEEAAEGDHGEHDVVRQLVEHDVLDLSDLLAGGIVDVGTDHLGGTDRGRVACSSWHGFLRQIAGCGASYPKITGPASALLPDECAMACRTVIAGLSGGTASG